MVALLRLGAAHIIGSQVGGIPEIRAIGDNCSRS